MNFPNAPTDGTTFAPAGGPSYVFSNGVWKLAGGGSAFVVVSDTAPPTPFPGQLWWESDSGALFFWYVDANSSQWVQINFTPSNSGIGSIVQTVITTSGTYTKPASLKFLEVTCVGGGGGVPALSTATAAGQSSGCSGAGGGATVIKLYANADLSATESYTVGAAGAIGGGGGTSSFKGLSSGGGAAGNPLVANSSPSFTGGGAGGAATGGDINAQGGQGGMGGRAIYSTLQGQGGSGGESLYAPRRPDQLVISLTNGSAGVFPGGGAAGGCMGASQAATTGAGGGAGVILLKEYF
jgi:hypothetical protein